MKKLRRYPDDGMFAGVCEGIGRYFEIDPSIIRIIWLLLFLGGGAGLLAYIVCWIAIPNGDYEDDVVS